MKKAQEDGFGEAGEAQGLVFCYLIIFINQSISN